MMKRLAMRCLVVAPLLVLVGAVALLHAQQEEAPAVDLQELPLFNRMVLDLAASYPDDGTHTYWWPRAGESSYDGCTRDIVLGGSVVMKGEEEGRTYCCGLTLEVFAILYERLRAEGRLLDEPLTSENFARFKRLWFVVDLNGPGPSAALEEVKLGREIPASEVIAGDFVQIWRTPGRAGRVSGHSVVFLNWVENEGGRKIGIRYWSTQTSTQGIGVATEYFGPMGGMSTEYTTFARVEIPGLEAVAGN